MAQNVSSVQLLIKGCTAVICRHVLQRSPAPANSFSSLLFLHMPIQTTLSQGKQVTLRPSSAAQPCLAIFCSVSEKKANLLLFPLFLIYLTCMHWSGWPWLVGISYRESSSLSSPAFLLLTFLCSTSPSRGHLIHWTYHSFTCLRNNPVSSLSWFWIWWRQVRKFLNIELSILWHVFKTICWLELMVSDGLFFFTIKFVAISY